MTLMAAGFLKLNMTVFESYLAERPIDKTCGWPFGCWSHYLRGSLTRNGVVVEQSRFVVSVDYWPALFDLLVALLIIIAIAYVLEWLIRRLEARKT
jgi:hypothetical protein